MNLKTLAATLGMSKTTVSRALNGYPEVNELTRQRVLDAARQHGYRANPLARSLALGRCNLVGLITPLDGSTLPEELLQGLTETLEERQINLVVAPVSPHKELAAYQQITRGRRVDGLVVCATRSDDPRIACLQEAAFPFVCHGRSEGDLPYAWTDLDHDSGMALAVQTLCAAGHRTLIYLAGLPTLHATALRRQRFAAGLAAADLRCLPASQVEHCTDYDSGYRAARAALAAHDGALAFIADHAAAGHGATRAVLDGGRPGCELITITHPAPRASGAQLARMLLALLDGAPVGLQQLLLQPLLHHSGKIA
jgi:LacI family transcriptional regulator